MEREQEMAAVNAVFYGMLELSETERETLARMLKAHYSRHSHEDMELVVKHQPQKPVALAR